MVGLKVSCEQSRKTHGIFGEFALTLVDFIYFFNSIVEKIHKNNTIYYTGLQKNHKNNTVYYKNMARGLSPDEGNGEVWLYTFGDNCDYIGKKIRLDSFVGKKNSMYNDLEYYHYFISSEDWKFKITLCAYYFGIPNIEQEKSENIFSFIKNHLNIKEKQYIKSPTRELEFGGDFEQFINDITLLSLYV